MRVGVTGEGEGSGKVENGEQEGEEDEDARRETWWGERRKGRSGREKGRDGLKGWGAR